jgi:hypothetical protein
MRTLQYFFVSTFDGQLVQTRTERIGWIRSRRWKLLKRLKAFGELSSLSVD